MHNNVKWRNNIENLYINKPGINKKLTVHSKSSWSKGLNCWKILESRFAVILSTKLNPHGIKVWLLDENYTVLLWISCGAWYEVIEWVLCTHKNEMRYYAVIALNKHIQLGIQANAYVDWLLIHNLILLVPWHVIGDRCIRIGCCNHSK